MGGPPGYAGLGRAHMKVTAVVHVIDTHHPRPTAQARMMVLLMCTDAACGGLAVRPDGSLGAAAEDVAPARCFTCGRTWPAGAEPHGLLAGR